MGGLLGGAFGFLVASGAVSSLRRRGRRAESPDDT